MSQASFATCHGHLSLLTLWQGRITETDRRRRHWKPSTLRREASKGKKWEKWVWNFHCPAPSLCTDAQLSRCSWPTDKWEKIVQFEQVVSSPSAAFQINERLPQVWQEIFLKHSWETGPYHCNPLAVPSIRQAPRCSRGDLVVALLPGFLFLHSPLNPLCSLGLHSLYFFYLIPT